MKENDMQGQDTIGIEYQLSYESARAIILARDAVTHCEPGPRRPDGTLDIPPIVARPILRVRVVIPAILDPISVYILGDDDFGDQTWSRLRGDRVLFGGGGFDADALIGIALRHSRLSASPASPRRTRNDALLFDLGAV